VARADDALVQIRQAGEKPTQECRRFAKGTWKTDGRIDL